MFEVVEYMSFFAVRHIASGKEHPMGDGVDTLFDENDKALSPGTEGFVEKWAEWLNSSQSETLEAYFPEIVLREELELSDPAILEEMDNEEFMDGYKGCRSGAQLSDNPWEDGPEHDDWNRGWGTAYIGECNNWAEFPDLLTVWDGKSS